LGALREIGLRDDRVSETLGHCLREGETGNDLLLASAIRVAGSLRDVRQTEHARTALASKNDDVVTAAAGFFIAIPDPSAESDIDAALTRGGAGNESRGGRDFIASRLLLALAATKQPSALKRVTEIIAESLKGKGAISAGRAEQIMNELHVSQTRPVYLKDLLRRLGETPTDYFNNFYTISLGATWCSDDLQELTQTTRKLEDEGVYVAERFFGAIDEAIQQKGEHSYREYNGSESAMRLAAKSESTKFVEEACQLLPLTGRYLSKALVEALWVIGDTRAEAALLQKFEQERQPGAEDDLHSDLISALGTCGGRRAAEVLLEYLRLKDLKIFLPTYAYYLLVVRGMLNENDLISAVNDRDAITPHGRADALWTLGAVNPQRHQELFLSVAAQADEDERVKERLCGAVARAYPR
jgi:hypothetical protein